MRRPVNKWIALATIYFLLAGEVFGNTTTTTISRLQLDHPDLGYDGGAALHTAVETMYTKIGDNMNSRYQEYTGIANSTTSTFTHNLGVAFTELQIRLYTGTGSSKVRIASPTASGWTIAATSGFLTTKVDVTTPSSGGPFSYSLVVIQGRGTEKLDDLDDVDLTTTSPQDGQALVYNGTTLQWSGGASGDSSLKCQSITTPNLVLKSGYLILGDASELQVASDLTVSLSTILGSSPANATAYYLYVDLDALPSATTLSNGRKVKVISTASHFSLQTSTPDSVLLSRYIPICEIKSATTGTAWSGTGSSFVTLATRRHDRPTMSVNPTVYALTQQAVSSVGTSGQIAAGHLLTSASFPTFTTNLSYYNLTSTSDGSGNARTLTNNGTTPFTATNILGTTSAAAALNGSSQSLSSTSTFFNPGNGTSFALGGWFKGTDWTPTAESCLIQQQQSTSDRGFGICVETSGAIRFVGTNTAGSYDLQMDYPNPGFVDGTWHHFALVYNFATTTLKGYVDGLPVITGTLANQRSVTSPVFQIGATNGTAASFFAGSAEEVFFTTLAVLDEDIRRTYAYRTDHNKGVSVANQTWDATFSGNLTNQFNRDWLINFNANSVFWDFSGLQSTDQVAVTMANKSFTTTMVPIYTYSTGKLTSAPSFPLSHGLSVIPKDFYVLTTGQSLTSKDDKRYDLCSADATTITCDLSSLTIDSTHQVEIVASAAPIAISVPVATSVLNGISSTFTPNATLSVKTVSSANYTVLDNDGYDLISVTTGASNRTITLPSASTNVGRLLRIKKADNGVGNVAVTRAGSDTIDANTTYTINAQYGDVELKCDGANWNVIAMVADASSVSSTFVFSGGGGAGTSSAVSIRYIRRGDWVHLSIPKVSATATGAPTVYTSQTAIESWARPSANIVTFQIPILNNNGGPIGNGYAELSTAGIFTVFRDVSATAFSAGTSGLRENLNFTYYVGTGS